MRTAILTFCTLVAAGAVSPASLRAQAFNARKTDDSVTTTIKPTEVEIVSLQVTKLPRDDFGHGVKPGQPGTIAFWLANSGTAVDLRITLDRAIAQFDEQASRIIRFADDKGSDLMQPPDGNPINTFFPDNTTIVVKPGLKPWEAEVVLRGFGVPARGATKLSIHADLVFLGGTDEKVAEGKDLEPRPGSEATIGPLKLRFQDPAQAPNLGRRLARFGAPREGAVQLGFEYEPSAKPIKSVACLNANGKEVASMKGEFLNREQGGTAWFSVPKMSKIGLRVVYFDKSGVVTVPLRLEAGIGF
jgi:hypothetical protein